VALLDADDSDLNADWIKTLGWDLPSDPEALRVMFGPDWYATLSRLPSWQAAPAEVRNAVVVKHYSGSHDQRSHAGKSGAELVQEKQSRDVDYLLRRGQWLDEQLARDGVALPPPRTVLDLLGEAADKVRKWVDEKQNPPLTALRESEIERIVVANRSRVDAERARRGLPPKDWPTWEGPEVRKADTAVIGALRTLFAGMVDDRVFQLMERDRRPLAEMDGPFADLMDVMLDAVARAVGDAAPTTVIKFAPGLMPVLKHGDPSRPGYAQMHPNGAGSAYAEWGDHAGRIAAMEDVGPSVEQLMLGTGGADDRTYNEIVNDILTNHVDEVDMTIDNDYAEYTRREEFLATNPSADETDAFIAEQRLEMAENLYNADPERYRGDRFDEDEALDAFNDVYSIETSGTNAAGDTVVLRSSVSSVWSGSDTIEVTGRIEDSYGDEVGEFIRHFQREPDGSVSVSHELLRLWDDNVKGTGFATEFNARAEDYYVSHGIKKIKVHAALEQGGYTWAAAGFDFDPSYVDTNRAEMVKVMSRSPQKASFEPIIDRMTRLGRDDPDYPTPFEISQLGRIPGASTWPGKEALLGSNWYGVKELRPEGRRRSATEQGGVVKHLSGQHDQQSHGKGGGGGEFSEWGDRAALLRQMKNVGPSRADLESALAGADAVDMDEMVDFVRTNFPDMVDDRVDSSFSQFLTDEERTAAGYDDEEWSDTVEYYKNEAARMLLEEDPDFFQGMVGGGTPMTGADAVEAFQEVYGIRHEGVDGSGRNRVLSVRVNQVDTFENEITVDGSILDEDTGDVVGTVQRKFLERDGEMIVSHEWFSIDDPDSRGTGLASALNDRAEAYYVSHGIDKVAVHAALETGGYAWASAGFDWDDGGDQFARESRLGVADRIDRYVARGPLTDRQRSEFTDIARRVRLPADDPDLATPTEISQFGRTDGASTWPGKEVLLGSDWFGMKTLRPEGRRRSITEQGAP
jgi:hypothetical protein